MIVKGECKFCKKVLQLNVADEYAEVGDPFKLISKAACNRCADLKTRQSRVEDSLKALTSALFAHPGQEERTLIRSGLCTATKAYLKIACAWVNAEGVAWEEQIVDQIMSHPRRLEVVTAHMWSMARSGSQGQLV